MIAPKDIERPIHFIDFGGNVGQSVAWAFDRYGEKVARVDTFEPQTENSVEILWRWGQTPSVSIHEVAGWIYDGMITFYPQLHGARTGSTVIPGKPSTSPDIYREVPCIDMARWIIENADRTINHVIIKVDIEGAEYIVLPHLLQNNVVGLADDVVR